MKSFRLINTVFFLVFPCFSSARSIGYLPEFGLAIEIIGPLEMEHNSNDVQVEELDVESLKGLKIHDYLYGGVIGPNSHGETVEWKRPTRIDKYKDHVDRGEVQIAASEKRPQIIELSKENSENSISPDEQLKDQTVT